MAQIFGIYLVVWGSMLMYQPQDGNIVPSVTPEKVYESIISIIEDSKYSNNIYEEAWDMFGAMAWESFADSDGIGSEGWDKVAFNPKSHTYDKNGLLAVGVFQLNVNHFADWIVEDMIRSGHADKFMSPNKFKTKKGYWRADDPNLDLKQDSYNAAKAYLKDKNNEAAILAWASDPNTWDKQVQIAKEAFNDREKAGQYGGNAWSAYLLGEQERGWNVLEEQFGYTRVNQLDLHEFAYQDRVLEDTTEVEQHSILDGMYKII